MLKAVLFLLAFLAVSWVHAGPEEWNYVPISSYTEVTTPGVVRFSSSPIRWVGMTISSPSSGSGGYVAIFKSSNEVVTPDLSTTTLVHTTYSGENDVPVYIPLMNVFSSSHTFLSKAGNAKVTLWFHCTAEPNRVCPGLGAFGNK